LPPYPLQLTFYERIQEEARGERKEARERDVDA
jgi:hypothetical protein